MNEPIVMRVDAKEHASPVFPVLWFLLTMLACELVITALQADIPWKKWFVRLIQVFVMPAAVIGLLHFASYLLRKRSTLLVGTEHLCLVTNRRFFAEKRQMIPIPEIVDITAYTSELVIKTKTGKYRFRYFNDACAFADRLRPYLRQRGAEVEKTALEHYSERLAITERWRRKRSGLMPYADIPVQIPATTDENGVPILPQQLSAEQAAGVFIPTESEAENKETATT